VLLALAGSSCATKDHPTAPNTGSTMPTVRGSVELPTHAAATYTIVDLMPNPAYPPVDITAISGIFMTDSVGAFEFFDVPGGHYFVLSGIGRSPLFLPLIGVPDFSFSDSLVASLPVTVTAPNAPAPPVHLTLVRPGVFKGRVVYDQSGLPTDALLATVGAITICSAGTNGEYVLPGVAPGSWKVRAIQFVDSVTTLVGDVTGVISTPGDTVTLPDIRISLTTPAAPAGAGSLGDAARELRRLAALRERRAAMLRPLERHR
jgi:hypothetical protein